MSDSVKSLPVRNGGWPRMAGQCYRARRVCGESRGPASTGRQGEADEDSALIFTAPVPIFRTHSTGNVQHCHRVVTGQRLELSHTQTRTHTILFRLFFFA